jgi:hypothetical protein
MMRASSQGLERSALDLSGGGDDLWKSTFDDDARADIYRRELAKDAATLRLLVPVSVQAGLHRLFPADPERVWAEISAVQLHMRVAC